MSFAAQKLMKPRAVANAEIALWLWTLWTTFEGIYSSWKQIPEVMDWSQGIVTLDPHRIMQVIIAGYGFVALLAIWIIIEIRKGKHWARSSFLWGFAFEILCFVFPPYDHNWITYILDIPDYGLQIYAVFLLYRKPGSDWFQKEKLANR